MFRVGIVAFQHESNTFLPQTTDIEAFARDLLAEGPAVADYYRAAQHEVTGFLDALDDAGAQAVPIFAAAAVPGGVVTAEAYDQIVSRMSDALAAAGPPDGLLVAPHGAGVSEREADMDGAWLSAVRQQVGTALPMVCTIDPHANLSPRMVAACDAIFPYRTNPHIDQRACGQRAAAVLLRTLRREVRPTMAAAFPAVAINIAAQHTQESPLRDWIAQAEAMRNQPKVLTAEIVLGFPYADVPELGSSAIVVTDNDPPLARALVEQLGRYLNDHREAFSPPLIGVEEALRQISVAAPPVCLLDMGDNVGGGSPGDGTHLAHAILRRNLGPALVCICDPDAAEHARSIGIGNNAPMLIGGKIDPICGAPIQIDAELVRLVDGKFTETSIRHGGKPSYDMGPSAVVRAGGLTVLIHPRRIPPFSLGQLTSAGLRPADFKIIIAKGVNAPLAAYAPVCQSFIRVSTPGLTSANMTDLPFNRRRRPLFPFEH